MFYVVFPTQTMIHSVAVNLLTFPNSEFCRLRQVNCKINKKQSVNVTCFNNFLERRQFTKVKVDTSCI